MGALCNMGRERACCFKGALRALDCQSLKLYTTSVLPACCATGRGSMAKGFTHVHPVEVALMKRWSAEGKRQSEIAALLGRSSRAVSNHLKRRGARTSPLGAAAPSRNSGDTCIRDLYGIYTGSIRDLYGILYGIYTGSHVS